MSMAETLARLGGTAGEVADSLRRLGVKGRQRRACDCPLARFLMRDARPEIDRVTVSWCCASRVATQGPTPGSWPELEFCSLPKACGDFVVEFDTGYYPDLVEEAS